jgi:hypothetical protein
MSGAANTRPSAPRISDFSVSHPFAAKLVAACSATMEQASAKEMGSAVMREEKAGG